MYVQKRKIGEQIHLTSPSGDKLTITLHDIVSRNVASLGFIREDDQETWQIERSPRPQRKA